MKSFQHFLLFMACTTFAATAASALIHDLKIQNDGRQQFFIEQFGFGPDGKIELEVLGMAINGVPIEETTLPVPGFVIQHRPTDYREEVEAQNAAGVSDTCPGVFAKADDFVILVNSSDVARTLTVTKPGFYNTFFLSCQEASAGENGQVVSGFTKDRVSFELKLTQYNIDPFTGEVNHLPAGQSGLPTLFLLFALIYLIWIIIWVTQYLRPYRKTVNRMHVLITAIYFLKMCSIFFHGMDKHYIKVQGAAHGWAVVYYIFASLKTLGMFLLIALIGTGFTFVKPFLSDRDKKIFMVVIPLQVIDNIAMIILEEAAPGSQDFAMVKDMFRLIDIICCGAILLPIIWSIKHLRDAAQGSGKARQSLAKLKLFREFYLLVVSYIYFTRIIVYLLQASLPLHRTWMADGAYEVATLAFLVSIGYKFRPAEDNPYFDLKHVDSDDEAVLAELHAINMESDDAGEHPNDDDQDAPRKKYAD